MLRTVLLTFAAAHTLRRTRRILAERRTLQIIPAAGLFSFGVHRIVAAECSGDIHAARARHAVTAAGASHLDVLCDLLPHRFHQRAVRLRHTPDAVFRSCAHVLFDHLHGIHAGEHAGHLRLVVQPLECQFCRGAVLLILCEQFLRRLRQQIDQPAAAQRLHDNHRNPLRMRVAQSLHARLRMFVHIIILDLAEIPVKAVTDFFEYIKLVME